MPDADIIPLGTRGRPGRGSRAASPSKAARSLAPSPRTRSRRSSVAPDDGGPAPEPPRRRRPRLVRPDDEGLTGTAAGERAPADSAVPDVSNDAAGTVPGTDAAPIDGAGDESLKDPAAAAEAAEHERAADEGSEAGSEESWTADAVTATLGFVRRRMTGDYEVDDFGFDADLTSTVLMRMLRPLAEKWFRIEVRGIENIPAEGGALLVSNHSGTLPLDALMTSLVVHDHADRHLRALGADLVFTLPFVSELARKGGATLACGDDAERMLAGGELVGVWPEGFKGIGKPYRERYKLQRFGRGGFVSAAIKTGVPIVPCSVVGAEEIYPMIGNIPGLAKLLKLPYVPVTPTFPWLGPLGMVPLPSKWVIEFGEPIRTDAYPDGAADDPMLVFNVKDQVRETIQQTLYTLLMHRTHIFY
jgi:1-acyl-sn-glycerol-3-phosphate acyltransferase